MSTALEPRPRSSGQLSFAGAHHVPRPDMGRLRVLVLYPHSRCNCRCQMCDIWRNEAQDELDPERIRQALPELLERGLERVVLSGGEPLMHSRLAELFEVFVDAGLGITLLTTGLLLEANAPLVLRHVDDLVVSLDGPPNVHDRIRRKVDAFVQLTRGVRAIRERREHDGSDVVISGRCTVQALNCDYIEQTVDAARDVGLDRISFLAVDVTSEAFDREGGWSSSRQASILPSRAQLEGLERVLDRMERERREAFASGFIAEQPEKLRSRLLSFFRAAHGLEPFRAPRCNAPWVSAVVEASGIVRPCFFQPAFGRWDTTGSIGEALDGELARAFRSELDLVENPTCSRCVCSLYLQEN